MCCHAIYLFEKLQLLIYHKKVEEIGALVFKYLFYIYMANENYQVILEIKLEYYALDLIS